jgi:hypothetical protein
MREAERVLRTANGFSHLIGKKPKPHDFGEIIATFANFGSKKLM